MGIRTISGLIGCGLLLLGTAFASADGGGWREQLASTWNNVSTGENIVIGRGQLGEWEVWSSNSGEGRITGESDKGANVTLDSRAGKCEYYLTVINANQLNMQLRAGPEACLKGVFLKVAATPVKTSYPHRHWKVCHC